MGQFDWSTAKNQMLIEELGISFDRIVAAIEQGRVVDVFEHPNQQRLPRAVDFTQWRSINTSYFGFHLCWAKMVTGF